MKKPKLQIPKLSKLTSVKLGASASSKTPSALLAKKNYSKADPPKDLISGANFGMTGLTGES